MHWLTKFFSRRLQVSRPARPARRSRLEVESLEDRLVPTVTFGGGSVLSNVEVQGVYLGANWQSPNSLATQQGQIETFLNSIVSGPYMQMLSNAGYGVGFGTTVQGVNDPMATGSSLADSTIRAELQQDITNRLVANPDANRLYVIYVQPNVVVNTSFGSSNTQNGGFNGYHGGFTGRDAAGNSIAINYAVIPYPGGSVNNLGGFSTDIQNLTEITSHELAEAVTNPLSSNKLRGWSDTNLGFGHDEIGDITENQSAAYVNLGGYLVQQVADKNDLMIPLSTVAYTTKWVSPAQTVAEMPNGSTYIIWGPNRDLYFHDSTGWNSVNVTGVQAISAGADGVLDVVFTNFDGPNSLFQLQTRAGTGFSSIVGWKSFTPLATNVNAVTEGANGEVFISYGFQGELREFVGGAWQGVGFNGKTPLGSGMKDVTALSEGGNRILDVVLGNDSLFQFNAATGFWTGSTPLAHNVSAVAAGAHGEVLITSGHDQRLGQLNLSTGAVTDWGDPFVASMSLGSDGILDVVFADDSLFQHPFGTSNWFKLLGAVPGGVAVV